MLRKYMPFIAAGFVASVAFLSGCNGTAPTVPKLTPAQIAGIVCPNVQGELDTLKAAGVFTGGAAQTLSNQISPDVDAVCAATATVTVANLENLSKATFPVVVAAVKASSLSDQDKTYAILAVGGIQTSLNTYLALQAASAPAAAATAASGAVAASAPAVASAPVAASQ